MGQSKPVRNLTFPMKTLIISFLALIALTFAVIAADTTAPKPATPGDVRLLKQQDGTIQVWFANRQAEASYHEIQRKLFPWGWRKLGTVRAPQAVFIDRHPAKRRAWYRVRTWVADQKSNWSTPQIIDP